MLVPNSIVINYQNPHRGRMHLQWARDETSSSALAVAPPLLKPRHRLQVARVIRRPHRYHRRHSRSHTPCWPRCWWPGLCLDGALHGEVDAGHSTRSHPWRGAGHDGALRDEVVVAWPVASTLDGAVRGRGHPWRGAGRDGALCGEVTVP